MRPWFDPPLRLEKSSSIARPANYFTTGNTVNVPSLCWRPLKVAPLNRRTKEFIIWWKPVPDGLYLAPFIQMSKVGVAMATTFFFLQTLNIYESWSVPPLKKKKKKFSFNAESKPLWSLNWKVSFNFFSINSTRNIPMEWELWPEFSPKHNFSGPMAWLLVGVMTSVARFSLSSKLISLLRPLVV